MSIMSLKGVKNNVHRNGFDLSFRNTFSAKVGELLPIFCKEVLPGDHFKIDLSSFTRTQPVQTSAFTRIKEYYDFFFVPYSLLWDKFPNWIINTGQYNHAVNYLEGPSLGNNGPYMSRNDVVRILDDLKSNDENDDRFVDAGGNSAYYSTKKLLNYLGYGTLDFQTDDIKLNPFPLFAYQKVYYDYFRNPLYEINRPEHYNLDYMFMAPNLKFQAYNQYSSDEHRDEVLGSDERMVENAFTMRYANYKKDLLFGLMPSPQYGETAIAAPIIGEQVVYSPNFLNGNNDESFNLDFDVDSSQYSLGQGAGVSIFAIRFAEAAQKWREVTNGGDLDYKSQLQRHWNVNVSDDQSYKCRWLGGKSGDIVINEVVNTNLSSETDRATIAGKGIGNNNGFITSEKFNEYGIIIGIYHAEPLLDYYNNFLSKLFMKTDVSDYAIPEFDALGMETVTNGEFGTVPNNESIGYAPRYYDYKTSLDLVNGVFTTTMQDWVTAVNRQQYFTDFINSYNRLTYPFFKIHPNILDTIFAAQSDGTLDSDQLLVSSYFDCKAVRNLDYNGLPY